MFGKPVQSMRLKVGSRAIVVGVAAVGLVALTGAWALASLQPEHVSGPSGSLASAVFRAAASAGSAASRTGSQAAGPQAGTPQTSQNTVPQVGAKLPAGLLLATPQGAAELSLRANAAGSAHSATGGGSTIQFHFGFTAQSHRNGNVAGTVTGNAEVVYLAPNPGPLHIDVNCIEIVGNNAYMSGLLTKSAFGLAKGTEMLFGVQDDDSAAGRDLISNIYFSPAPAYTCHTYHAKPLFTVQGNIEIH
jgi:hypothetical protein